MYKKIIKPILFKIPPDAVHNLMLSCGKIIQVLPPARWVIRKLWRRDDEFLRQELLGIDFINPVGLSAGFDKNIELTPLIESVGFGFETGGSVSLPPRVGNPRPWFHRLPNTKSLVVHAGMANKGLEVISESIRKNQKRLGNLPLFISVAVVGRDKACSIDDAIRDAVDATRYIIDNRLAQGVEINISCPNVGDNQPFAEPETLEKLLSELDSVGRNIPFLIKMPNLVDLDRLDAILKVIVRHNVQAVTTANLVKDRMRVDLKDELSPEVKGGLSGEPTRESSLEMIRFTYQNYGDRLKIIGVGGVFSAEDAYQKIKAGASLVALITGMIFEGPQLIGQINTGLVRLARQDGLTAITEAVGLDHRKSPEKS